jgi:hypothetical protein
MSKSRENMIMEAAIQGEYLAHYRRAEEERRYFKGRLKELSARECKQALKQARGVLLAQAERDNLSVQAERITRVINHQDFTRKSESFRNTVVKHALKVEENLRSFNTLAAEKAQAFREKWGMWADDFLNAYGELH